MASATVRRWPLFLIAAPAAVAVWSGWVGLGELAGFGVIHPLPGIIPGFQLNTAITLPVGVEAYGAYALGAWLSPGPAGTVKTFAKRSAIGALALGMLGQIVYHLLAAAHSTRAPWPVVMLVACLPVMTLGFGVALTHLIRSEPVPETEPKQQPDTRLLDSSGTEWVLGPAPTAAPELSLVPEHDGLLLDVFSPAPKSTRDYTPKSTRRSAPQEHPVSDFDTERLFMDELAAGTLPSKRAIRSRCHVGAPKADQIHAHLGNLLAEGRATR